MPSRHEELPLDGVRTVPVEERKSKVRVEEFAPEAAPGMTVSGLVDSLPDIFAALAAEPDTTTFFDLPVSEVVGALIALSAFARSAQFLLHTWLPYTMDGPTPVSALMHAGIVNAGGFLINRFAPVYAVTDGVWTGAGVGSRARSARVRWRARGRISRCQPSG